MDEQVLTLVERVRQELSPVAARILGHRYLDALQAGRIGREQFRLFAALASTL